MYESNVAFLEFSQQSISTKSAVVFWTMNTLADGCYLRDEALSFDSMVYELKHFSIAQTCSYHVVCS